MIFPLLLTTLWIVTGLTWFAGWELFIGSIILSVCVSLVVYFDRY